MAKTLGTCLTSSAGESKTDLQPSLIRYYELQGNRTQ